MDPTKVTEEQTHRITLESAGAGMTDRQSDHMGLGLQGNEQGGEHGYGQSGESSGRLITKDHRISVPLLQCKENAAH